MNDNGQPKGLEQMINELKSAGTYNEVQASHLRAWARIRNSAAHGKFDEFNRGQVERMLPGVKSFLADHLV
jgi:hypothetical protein